MSSGSHLKPKSLTPGGGPRGYDDQQAPTTPDGRLKNSAITDQGLGDKLTRIMQTYMKERSLNQTLQTCVKEACKVFACGYARIIISNKLLAQCNAESEG